MGEARRGAIPCRAGALARVRRESPRGSDGARRWELLDAAQQTMIIPPRFAAYPQCEDAIWRCVQRALQGTTTPRDALQEAASAIGELAAAFRPVSR